MYAHTDALITPVLSSDLKEESSSPPLVLTRDAAVGVGSHATVYRCATNRPDGLLVALKEPHASIPADWVRVLCVGPFPSRPSAIRHAD